MEVSSGQFEMQHNLPERKFANEIYGNLVMMVNNLNLEFPPPPYLSLPDNKTPLLFDCNAPRIVVTLKLE